MSAQDQTATNITSEALNINATPDSINATPAATPSPMEISTITRKNPTFQEVKDFILKDSADSNPFVLGKYECRHFATEVVNNAESAGIRCGFAMIGYNQGQHAVAAFDTPDQGLVFVEPQTDAFIQPSVGGTYQDKEITEILIAW